MSAKRKRTPLTWEPPYVKMGRKPSQVVKDAAQREIKEPTLEQQHSDIWPCEHCAALDPDYLKKGPPKPDEPARLLQAEKAYQFILGGNATFTLRSQASGTRYTYKVTLAEKRPQDRENELPKYFVALLSGPDNTSNFTYLGMIRANKFQLTIASRMKADSLPVKAIDWTFSNLVQHRFPEKLEIWHEGRCGRCNRKLTVPESIQTGFGPECAGRMGL